MTLTDRSFIQDTQSTSPPTRPSSTPLTPPCTTQPRQAAWPSHMERAVHVRLGLALVLFRLVLVGLVLAEVGLLVVSQTTMFVAMLYT
jgi:hypothetical protein